MLRFVIIGVLAATLRGATSDLYSDCGSTLAAVEKVSITDCDPGEDECILHRSTNVTIAIDFTTKDAVSKLTTVVHGVMKGLPIPFPLEQPDACRDSGLACPLPPGSKQEYRSAMQVLKAYPKVKVDVKWELKNDADESVVCVLIPAKIE